jgi:PAS domain-containing protein
VAFLIEDISSEVSLTRRFRAELEMGQAVFDSLEEAIAVFSPAGVLTFSNAAYAELWRSDPSVTLHEVSIYDATHHWAENCGKTDFWARAQDFVNGLGPRAGFSATVDRPGGETLNCRLAPIAGGATLIGFTPVLPVGAEAADAGAGTALPVD